MHNTDDTTSRHKIKEARVRKSFDQTLIGQLLLEAGSSALVGLGDTMSTMFKEYRVDGKPRNRH